MLKLPFKDGEILASPLATTESSELDDIVFDPSLPATSFPFPPTSTVAVRLANFPMSADTTSAAAATSATTTTQPEVIKLDPTPSPKRRTSKEKGAYEAGPKPEEETEEDDLSKLSLASVSIDEVSSSSSSSDEDDSPNQPPLPFIHHTSTAATQPSKDSLHLDTKPSTLATTTLSPSSGENLLAISPLPSPSSRHGSIIAAASELTAPPEFGGGGQVDEAEKAVEAAAKATIRPSKEDDEVANPPRTLDVVTEDPPGSLLASPSGQSSTSGGSAPRSKSRQSSRLSSVPEGAPVQGAAALGAAAVVPVPAPAIEMDSGSGGSGNELRPDQGMIRRASGKTF